MARPTNAYELCETYRLLILETLEAAGSAPVTTSYTGLGLVAWDDCCGQLTVGTERIFRYIEFPVEAVGAEQCFTGDYGVNLVVTLVRCVPTPDDMGNPPSAEALAAAHKAVQDDASAVWAALNGPIPGFRGDEWERAGLNQTFVGGEGGCIAVESRLTIGVDEADWCLP